MHLEDVHSNPFLFNQLILTPKLIITCLGKRYLLIKMHGKEIGFCRYCMGKETGSITNVDKLRNVNKGISYKSPAVCMETM